jgi:CheY-like chemotaxis protein
VSKGGYLLVDLFGKRILLVDDEPDIITTTSLALSTGGFQVITAASAEIALEKSVANIRIC